MTVRWRRYSGSRTTVSGSSLVRNPVSTTSGMLRSHRPPSRRQRNTSTGSSRAGHTPTWTTTTRNRWAAPSQSYYHMFTYSQEEEDWVLIVPPLEPGPTAHLLRRSEGHRRRAGEGVRAPELCSRVWWNCGPVRGLLFLYHLPARGDTHSRLHLQVLYKVGPAPPRSYNSSFAKLLSHF